MTSVRELELELNVSKVSLYAILRKDAFKGHVVKGEKNMMMVDDAGVVKLKEYYFNKNRGGTPRKNTMGVLERSPEGVESEGKEQGKGKKGPKREPSNMDEHGIISILQEQLAKKDEQIENLLGIVSGQQKIRA